MKIKNKKQLFIGAALILLGLSILTFFGYNRISSEIRKRKLLRTCVVLEIPSADIRVPVVEGTDSKDLHIAAGRFKNTGSPGKGNYCIAGHNSTIYAEVFNTLSRTKNGDKVYLTDNNKDKTKYTYTVTDINIVEPSDTWVLRDFGDDRITIVTCTDDGKQRRIVTAMKDE